MLTKAKSSNPLLRVALGLHLTSLLAFASVDAPVFNPSDGDSPAIHVVTVTAPTPSSVVRYTINGADPTLSDPVVISGGSIQISKSLTLKAKAWLGTESSSVTTAQFRLTAAVSCGESHMVGMKTSGQVLAWGLQTNGRLGNAATGAGNISNPVASLNSSSTADPIKNAIWLSAGDAHTLILRSDLTVSAYGLNSTGQLGDNTITQRGYASPVQISGGNLTNCQSVAAGDTFSIALKTDGSVWTWGSRSGGRLSDGATTSYTKLAAAASKDGGGALNGIRQIAAGTGYGIAREPSASESSGGQGFVWAWGLNTDGQLAQGNNTSLSLAKKMKLSAGATDFVTDVTDISAGAEHAAMVRWKNGDPNLQGTVWCVGQRQYGRLGNVLTVPTTAGVVSYPVKVIKADGNALENVVAVAAGASHTLALDTSGNVWSWGYNGRGALGSGSSDTANRAHAAKVLNASGTGDLANIVAIDAGGTSLNGSSVAIASDGSVYTWGYNGNGQLGNGTNTTAANRLPIKIGTVPLDLIPSPPAVALTRQVNQSFAPGNISLQATVTDEDGDIQKVQFYANGALLTEKTSSPWTWTMSNLAAGTYSEIKAVATDSTGIVESSVPLEATIVPPSPPTISLTALVTAPSFPGAASLIASPLDPDGDLVRVDLYSDSQLIAQLTSAPWQLNLSNLREGTYQVRAYATDSMNLTGSSTLVTFSINYDSTAANLDADGDGLSDSYEITLGLSPTDADTDGDGIPDGSDSNPLMPNSIVPPNASTILIWAPLE